MCLLTESQFSAILPIVPSSGVKSTDINKENHSSSPYITAEQQQAVAHICKVATGKRKQPLVLTANRGRGKSSALGLAVAKLFNLGYQHILLTAPNIHTVEQVFQQAQGQLPKSTRQGLKLVVEEKVLQFMPFDQILIHQPDTQLLLVDEAAAIPSKVLEQLTKTYSRLVFSSTIHGYEGSGRGFELRFLPYLRQHMPALKTQHLTQAIRWSDGDCLEQFWFDALLMQGEQIPTSIKLDGPVTFQQYSGRDLLGKPDRLSAIFSLLVNAHYQTTPDDLARLLDGPENHLYTLEQNEQVLAVCWSCLEGGEVLAPIQQAVLQGKRRVPGHLLAQNLSYYYLKSELVELTYLRIVRIAVLPGHQQQGLGSRLLDQLKHSLHQRADIDFIGSSFAANAPLLNFWFKNQFQCVRFGHKKDASSGEFSAQILYPLSSAAQQSLPELNKQFNEDWLYQLNTLYQQVDASSVWAILTQQSDPHRVSSHQLEVASQFALGQRPLAFCQRALYDLLLDTLPKLSLSLEQKQLAVSVLLQQKETRNSLPSLSRKALQQQMREVISLCLVQVSKETTDHDHGVGPAAAE